MRPWLGAALLTFGLAAPAAAWGWLQAPVTPQDNPEQSELDEASAYADEVPSLASPIDAGSGVCIAAILAAEARYGIPDNLLLALGLQEAGYSGPQGLTVWPWSVNAAGEGRRFANRHQAEAFVIQKQAQGVASIDVGCLQINLRWHPDAFATLSQGFEPVRNVGYAARYLLELYQESGDWWVAAGRYHSRSEGPQATYLASLTRNLGVAQARLPQFAALAETVEFGIGGFGDGAGPHGLPVASGGYLRAAAPRREPTPYRSEGAIWGAAIAGAEGDRRSLYSALDLEPILPNFQEPES